MCVHLRKLHLLSFTYFQRKPHCENHLNPSAFTHINILLLFIHKNFYKLKWNSLDKAKNKSLIETNAWQTYWRSYGWTDGRTNSQLLLLLGMNHLMCLLSSGVTGSENTNNFVIFQAPGTLLSICNNLQSPSEELIDNNTMTTIKCRIYGKRRFVCDRRNKRKSFIWFI